MRTLFAIPFALLICLSSVEMIRADEKLDAEARRAIKQTVEELDAAYNRGDAKGTAACYTENAMHFPPNLPINKGRAEIQKFNQDSLDAGFKGMESILFEIEVHGDVAFAAGDMLLWTTDKSKAGKGKFTLFLKKIDNKWLLHRDCGNSSEPAK